MTGESKAFFYFHQILVVLPFPSLIVLSNPVSHSYPCNNTCLLQVNFKHMHTVLLYFVFKYCSQSPLFKAFVYVQSFSDPTVNFRCFANCARKTTQKLSWIFLWVFISLKVDTGYSSFWVFKFLFFIPGTHKEPVKFEWIQAYKQINRLKIHITEIKEENKKQITLPSCISIYKIHCFN